MSDRERVAAVRRGIASQLGDRCVAGRRLVSAFGETFGDGREQAALFGAPGYLPAAARAVDLLTVGCSGRADDLHEPWTRARGGPTDDPRNCLPVCRPCHGWLTDYAALAELLRTKDGVPYVLRDREAFGDVWPGFLRVPAMAWVHDLASMQYVWCPVGNGVSDAWRIRVGRAMADLDAMRHATYARPHER
jgi:hypothetical protein